MWQDLGRRLWQWLRHWRRRSPPKPRAPRGQEFTLRRAILDELPFYFKCLNRLARDDADIYALLSKTGIHMMRPDQPLERAEPTALDGWWKTNRPAFGAVAYGTTARILADEKAHNAANPSKKIHHARFLFFTRYDPKLAPPTLQRTNAGDVYKLTVYYADPDHVNELAGRSGGTEYAVAIGADGTLTVLRMLLPDRTRIRAKHGYNRGHTFTLPVQRWGLPPVYHEWAGEHHEAVAPFLTSVFNTAARATLESQLGSAQVRVTKGATAACFNIEIKHCTKFFSDRERISENGKTKRIFHIVRAHARKTGALVRFHFRGQRSFAWHGYQVTISIPGLHEASLLEYQEQLADEDMIDDRRGWESLAHAGKLFADYFSKSAALPNKQSRLRGMIQPPENSR